MTENEAIDRLQRRLKSGAALRRCGAERGTATLLVESGRHRNGNLMGVPYGSIAVKVHPRHTAWLDQSSDHGHDGSLNGPPESAEETTAKALLLRDLRVEATDAGQ